MDDKIMRAFVEIDRDAVEKRKIAVCFFGKSMLQAKPSKIFLGLLRQLLVAWRYENLYPCHK